MADTVSSLLAPWSAFYAMLGGSAAALTGLMFVVITLVTRRDRTEDIHDGIAVFSTPTVAHFAGALLISAVFLAPWRSLVDVGIAAAAVGVYGVVRILLAMRRTRRLTMYTADLEDWTWFTILPLVAYGAVAAGAAVLAEDPVPALFILAGGVVLLMFIGIRNAWDVVTYIALDRP